MAIVNALTHAALGIQPMPRRPSIHEIAAASRIFTVRETRVMLDVDLADLYGVTTGALVQAVKRNARRFPPDFMFQLTEQEVRDLKSHSVILPQNGLRYWGRRRRAPYAFTEQGVAMLSSVLRSDRAVDANIAIMRAFVRLRQVAAANVELARKLEDIEQRVSGHDEAIAGIVRAIRELAAPPQAQPRRRIGFVTEN